MVGESHDEPDGRNHRHFKNIWQNNRAQFHEGGITLEDPSQAETLEPLPREGLYRVLETFTCCEKECRSFEPGLLVQLGYDGKGQPILFVPHWHADGLHLPERGAKLADDRLPKLERLKVSNEKPDSATDTLQ